MAQAAEAMRYRDEWMKNVVCVDSVDELVQLRFALLSFQVCFARLNRRF